MREIKFRGKPIFADGRQSNYFVYGHYFQLNQNGVIRHVIHSLYDGGKYIDPDTLGEFAGVFDQNGKEVYEGDILQDKTGRIFQVVFERGRFQRYNEEFGAIYLSRGDYEVLPSMIIGNIHDNPELMEGGEQ